jgi:tetratricopeptide (TPR) repeat protein
VSHYQRARELLPTAAGNFRLLRASYVASSPFSGDYDMDVHQSLEMARASAREQDWEGVRFWSVAALRVEDQSDAHCYLGQAALAEADATGAIAADLAAWDLNRFLTEESRLQCAFDLARAYYATQDWSSGDAWFEQHTQLAHNRRPTDETYQALAELARLNLAGGRPEGAESLLNSAVEAMPDNVWVYTAFLDTYLGHEFYQAAAAVCETMPTEMQETLPTLTRCGSAFYGVQDWQKAAAMYEGFLAQRPDDPWAHYWLADIHMHLGLVDQAAFHAGTAVKLAPTSLPISLGVGELYEQMGDPSAALHVYRSVLEAHPEDTRVQEAIKRLEQ